MGYRERLASLDGPGSLFGPERRRIVLLAGQSSFDSSALSAGQLAFLEAVKPPGWGIVRAGFPFHDSFAGDGFRKTGLVRASWRNARQVWWSIASPVFVNAVARRLQESVDTTAERLALLTGSCGLQLVNAVWPMLRLPGELRVDVVAMGPVCLQPTRMAVTSVQGRRDVWSRMLYGGPVDHLCDGGHLDYWESEEARVVVEGLLR